MDWKFLYLDPKGRIGQKDFWIGVLILIVVSIVIGAILSFAVMSMPIISQLFGLLMLYPYYCLASKRLHDFGKSETLAMVVTGANALVSIVGMVMAPAAVGMAMGDPTAMSAGLGGAMLLGSLGLVVGLASLAFVLWIGLSKGDPAPNQYGPPRANPAVAA